MKKKFNSIYRWIAMLAVTAVVVTAMPVDNGLTAIASEVGQDGETESGNDTSTENDNSNTGGNGSQSAGNNENTSSDDNKESTTENAETVSKDNGDSSGDGNNTYSESSSTGSSQGDSSSSQGSSTGSSQDSSSSSSDGSSAGSSQGSSSSSEGSSKTDGTDSSEGNSGTEPEKEEEKEPELVEVSPTLSCSDSGKVEMGSELVLSVANQEAKGSYTIVAGESNPGSAGEIKIENGKCTLPTGTVGNYTFKVTYTSENGTKSKNADVKYTVKKGLTVKINEDAVIEKKSDGTTKLPEGIDVNYFTIEGKPDGVELALSIKNDKSNDWAYTSALPVSAENTNVKIINISNDDFSVDNDFYYIKDDSKDLEIVGKITPVKINQKELDLTKGTDWQSDEGKPYFEFKLTDNKTAQITFPEDSVVDGWINTNYGEDHKMPEEGGVFYNDTGFTDENKIKLEEGEKEDIVTCENLYFVKDDVVYGPLTLTYKCDYTLPGLGSVSLDPELDKDAKGNQPALSKDHLKAAISEDGALVARKNDMTVNAEAGEETKEGHWAKVYIYATDAAGAEIGDIDPNKFSEKFSLKIEANKTKHNYVYIRLIDQAGNTKDLAVDRTLLTDIKPPTIDLQVKFIKNEEDGYTYAYVVASGKDEASDEGKDDASGIYQIKLTIYDDTELYMTKEITGEDYNGKNALEGSLTIGKEETERLKGLHLWAKAEVTDYAGNCFEAQTKEFQSYTVYPVEFSFNPSEEKGILDEDGNYYYNESRTLSVLAENGYPEDSFTFNVDGEEITWDLEYDAKDKHAYVIPNEKINFSDGAHTVAFTPSESIEQLINEGKLKLTVDGLVKGNTSFIVDTEAPVVTLAAGSDIKPNKYEDEPEKGVYFRSDFWYSFTVEDDNFDPEQILTEYNFDNQEIKGSTANAKLDENSEDNVWTWTVESQNGEHDGVYTFEIYGTDKAGNSIVIKEVPETNYFTEKPESGPYTVENPYSTDKKVIDTIDPVVKMDAGSASEPNKYAAEKSVYFRSEKFWYSFTVNDVNYNSERINTDYTFDNQEIDGSNANAKLDENSEDNIWTWTIESQNGEHDGIYTFDIGGTDMAGNAIVIKEVPGTNYFTEDAEKIKSGSYTMDNPFTTDKKVMDTIAPVVTMDAGSDPEPNKYAAEKSVYFRSEKFWYSFTVNDINFENELIQSGFTFTDQSISGVSKDYSPEMDNTVNNVWKWTVESKQGSYDGIYTFTIGGTDRAGNEIVIKEVPDTSYFTEDTEEIKTESYTTGEPYTTDNKVMDTVNPVFDLVLNDPDDEEHVDTSTNTTYSNEDLTAEFTITDINFDNKRIGAGYASKTGNGNYEKMAAEIAWSNVDPGANYDKDKALYSFTVSDDGVYLFEIAGTDKAGNALIQSQTEIDKGNATKWKATRQHAEGEYYTYAKVIDTNKPNATLTIAKSAGSKAYYEYEINGSEGVNYSEPFRKDETQATARIKVDTDNSPVKIAYTVSSTKQGATRKSSDNGYVYMNSVSVTTENAPQSITVKGITIKDKAGNTRTVKTTNEISLDNGTPVIDSLAPVINFTVLADASVYGPGGQKLYKTGNGPLDIKYTVHDPNPNTSSSGLDHITYELWINGKVHYRSAERNNVNHTTKFNANYEDLFDKITFGETIGVDGKEYNYNDCKMVVTATDRAGHKTTREVPFGIDNTAPKIKVSYDNNSAMNGKYFKEIRTATIEVTERNFSASATNISTQAAASQSGWSRDSSNAGANGDGTIWRKRITYSADGDYTFNITSKDMLGWEAPAADYGNSVAPREFTIDRTKPVITITFDNNDRQNIVNGVEYYKAARTATVTINEHNFGNGDVIKVVPTATNPDPSVSISTPSVNGWGGGGDSHSASINCSTDGEYYIVANYTDMAGNVADEVKTVHYVVDCTQPTIEWAEGTVKDKMAYSGNIAPSVLFGDNFIDWEGVTFTLTGARNGPVTVTEQDVQRITDFLATKSYSNFPVNRDYDDIYTLTAHVSDLAKNENEITITFSVNRFGSTWDYNEDETTIKVNNAFYINKEQPLVIREINPTKVEQWTAYISHNGEYYELTEGTDYTMAPNRGGNTGWNEYIYHFNQELFAEEGDYEVIVESVDEAKHSNSNKTVHEKDGKTSSVVPSFIVDKTNPRTALASSMDAEKLNYLQDSLDVVFVPTDNYVLSKVDIYVNDELVDSYFNEKNNDRLTKTLEANNGEITYTLNAEGRRQEIKVITTDAAGNVSGYDIEGNLIDMSDDPEILTWAPVVTRNIAVQYFNIKPLFYGSIGTAGGLLLLFLLLKRRKKDEEEA